MTLPKHSFRDAGEQKLDGK